MIVALLTLGALAPAASAAIPAPPSKWYKLPGLNAASGAQWVRAYAYSTPPNIVYAGLEGGGVFKSTNGGATWSAFNSGFPNPLTTNVRALLTSSTGTTVFAGTDAGLYKSTGGAWQPHAQGTEDNPAQPKKLNESVQSLVSLTGGSVMLAGVFSGGVYKSSDGGDTWSPPPANSGMPSSETVYGLTENVPGLVYATAGSGVYVSTDQGSTWTRKSDGIPGSASPITTWVYPQRPQILFTSTGSERHLPLDQRRLDLGADQQRPRCRARPRAADLPGVVDAGGAPLRGDGGRAVGGAQRELGRAAAAQVAQGDPGRPDRTRRAQRDHVVAHRAGHPGRRRARPDRRHAVQRRLLPLVRTAGQRVPEHAQHHDRLPAHQRHHADRGPDPAGAQRQVDRHRHHRVRLPVAELHVDVDGRLHGHRGRRGDELRRPEQLDVRATASR